MVRTVIKETTKAELTTKDYEGGFTLRFSTKSWVASIDIEYDIDGKAIDPVKSADLLAAVESLIETGKHKLWKAMI